MTTTTTRTAVAGRGLGRGGARILPLPLVPIVATPVVGRGRGLPFAVAAEESPVVGGARPRIPHPDSGRPVVVDSDTTSDEAPEFMTVGLMFRHGATTS